MPAQKFRKIPVTVEAIRYDGTTESISEISIWMRMQLLAEPQKDNSGNVIFGGGQVLLIPTLEGAMRANPGDWIIRGVAGEFYPCQAGIFQKTYERVL